MSQQNLLFFSTKCRYCQSFLEELARTPYTKEFRFICVDPPRREALPGYVKAVPTLMIAGESEPRTDGAVMNWLSERRLHERSNLPTPSTGQGRPPVGGGPITSMGDGNGSGLDGFFGAEAFGDAGGGGGGYAFLTDDTSASQSAMVRLAGNMASLSDTGLHTPDARGLMMTGNMMAATAGSGSGSGSGSGGQSRTSEKQKALDDAFERMRAARDRDIPGPPQRR